RATPKRESEHVAPSRGLDSPLQRTVAGRAPQSVDKGDKTKGAAPSKQVPKEVCTHRKELSPKPRVDLAKVDRNEKRQAREDERSQPSPPSEIREKERRHKHVKGTHPVEKRDP